MDFISLCTDDEADDSTGDIEMEVICSGKKRRLVSQMEVCETPVTKKLKKRPEGVSQQPEKQQPPDAYSFNPLDQTAIHPASYEVATA